jgi:hypothetical protein
MGFTAKYYMRKSLSLSSTLLSFKHLMRKILNAKISSRHFSAVFIIALLFCSFLYIFGIPIIYWFAFGEGEASSRIDEIPINAFIQNWGALIVILLMCLVAWIYNINKQEFRFAKSYMITAIIILVIYIFRIPIAELLIGFSSK